MENSKIIVEGEASESDEENFSVPEEPSDPETTVTAHTSGSATDINQTDGSKTASTGVVVPQKDAEVSGNTGVIVSGEASESDEEFEIVTSEGELLHLNVNTSEKGDTTEVTTPQSPLFATQQRDTKIKYNTLLNRKLREKNIALRRHIVDTTHQSYTQAANGLHNLTVQLQKSHIAIQDVSHYMRNATNDLFNLEDKVDIVRSCNILPYINLPEKPVTPSTAVQS